MATEITVHSFFESLRNLTVVLFTFIFYTKDDAVKRSEELKTWPEHKQEMILEDRTEWAVCLLYATIVFAAAVLLVS